LDSPRFGPKDLIEKKPVIDFAMDFWWMFNKGTSKVRFGCIGLRLSPSREDIG